MTVKRHYQLVALTAQGGRDTTYHHGKEPVRRQLRKYGKQVIRCEVWVHLGPAVWRQLYLGRPVLSRLFDEENAL
jgi:hypothetical protein